MYVTVEHIGNAAWLPNLLSTLSACLPFDICLQQEASRSVGTDTPRLLIILADEMAELALAAVNMRCSLPGSVPTIVIDARFDPLYRDQYLQVGVVDYLDFAEFDTHSLKRTIDIAARVQRSYSNEHLKTKKFSRLCDTMQVGTWEWDLRKNSFVWSPREFALFGIDASLTQLVYESWRDAIHPLDRERVEAELGRAIVGQADYHSVFRIYKTSGKGQAELRWIEGVGSVQRDVHGAALSMYGLNWDVTSKYQALADLEARRDCKSCLSHQSRNTFQTYFEQSIDCLVYLTEAADGRLIYAAINQSGLDHVKLTRDQVLGRTPSDILGSDAGGIVEDAMRTAMRTGKPYLYRPTFEMGGATFTYDVSYIPIIDNSGAVVGVLGSARDITTARRMEESLVRAQKMEALGQIASGTAHDFNNVLQNLSSALDMLEYLDAHGARQEAARIARSALKNGRALTSSLLSFARREAVETCSANLNQVIADIREMIRMTLGSHIELRIETDPALWPVLIDEQQIELALINLAVNSRDAMPDGGTLTITASNVDIAEPGVDTAAGSFVRLSIADTGAGMTPDVLARATEPFYTTKAAGKGTGLGLNMVRMATESMGGTLRIDSIVGQGTTVSLFLARAASTPVLPAPVATSATHAPSDLGTFGALSN